MIWDQTKPCATCPYRRDTKRALWSEAEFIALRRHDAVPLDSPVYACHSSAVRPQPERRPCAGWLLDQKRRGLPSISLRLALIQKPEARELMDRVSDGGAELYDSIQEMHEANYPPRRRRAR
jgi:hypothetical protein